jgi:hypothetical protein
VQLEVLEQQALLAQLDLQVQLVLIQLLLAQQVPRVPRALRALLVQQEQTLQ